MTPAHRLRAAAAFSFAVALLHLGAIFWGPDAYAYLAAEGLARREAAGSWLPDLLTLGLVAMFAAFGGYALAGAGAARRPPALLPGLLAIGALYTLRGAMVVPEALLLASGGAAFPPRYALFSLASLLGGVLYLGGALPLWRARRAG